MELPPKVAGRDPREMRDLFRAFVDEAREAEWSPTSPPRVMDASYASLKLGLELPAAEKLVAALVDEGWLKDRLVPSTRGMALANHNDRDRLPRAQADKIVRDLLDWADSLNATAPRVGVMSIEIYGSYESALPDVGDIDVIVIFTTHDLIQSGDIEPEDEEREDELLEEIAAISEYISPAGLLDRLNMPHAKFRLIYGQHVPDPELPEDDDGILDRSAVPR